MRSNKPKKVIRYFSKYDHYQIMKHSRTEDSDEDFPWLGEGRSGICSDPPLAAPSASPRKRWGVQELTDLWSTWTVHWVKKKTVRVYSPHTAAEEASPHRQYLTSNPQYLTSNPHHHRPKRRHRPRAAQPRVIFLWATLPQKLWGALG